MIRKAVLSDLPALLEIYAKARTFMAENGNPTQWGSSYPDETDLREDIAAGRLYVLADEHGTPCACFMLAPGPDATYRDIFQGAWLQDAPYGVLHRVASDGTQRGVVSACIAFAARQFSYLRIDTHEKNLPMQRALAREGFVHRGTIFVEDGTPRLAYDRMQ